MSDDFAEMADQLRTVLMDKFGLRSGSLAEMHDRMDRRFPRRVRRAVSVVATAQAHAGHRRLRTMTDSDKVQRAHRMALAWLKSQNLQARRAQSRRSVLAAMAFNIGLAVALGITCLALMGKIGPGASP